MGGQTPSGYPGRNSRLVLAMFPGGGALLSCNHGSVSIVVDALFSYKTEQFWADTKRPTS